MLPLLIQMREHDMTNPNIDLSRIRTIDEVIAEARRVIEPGPYWWVAAGAGEGVTLARNSLALNRLGLIPRMLNDVSTVDTSTSFLGVPLSIPVMMAPIGALSLYHPDDALASARAATAAGTSSFCGILTTSAWEDVAATAPGHHFLQIYVLGDRSWLAEIIQRAELARFAGLCITVDSPVIGRRDRNLIDDFTWSAYTAEGPVNLRGHGFDPEHKKRFTWTDLEWVCGQTKLPVVLKGVMAAVDATRAADCGVAGIYVSNHGGRAIDHGISTIEVLGEIVDAIDNKAEVIVDSGFVRGVEICKALALGARAVGIGKLQCWALALGGAAGLIRLLEILRDELLSTMTNLGCRTITEITRDHVRWSIPARAPDWPADPSK